MLSLSPRREIQAESSRMLSATELAAMAASKPIGVASPAPASNVDRTLSRAATKPATDPIQIIAHLREPPFDFAALQSLSGSARASHLAQRVADLVPTQDTFEKAAVALGASSIERFAIANLVSVVLPAGKVPALSMLPDVIDLSLNDVPSPAEGYSGRGVRDATQSDKLISLGHPASTGNRLSAANPVRIGVVEFTGFADGVDHSQNDLHWNHPGFSGRVLNVRECAGPGTYCTEVSSPPIRAFNTHGTEVASVAAGSIEAGQDPNYPGYQTDAQRKRSFQAPSARIQYFRTPDYVAWVRALQSAIWELGTDVLNFSQGYKLVCDQGATLDWGGFNYAVRFALDAGVVTVFSAGNEQHADSACTLRYPAWRPEVLSVGGVDTEVSQRPAFDPPYPRAEASEFSSRGGVPIRTASGLSTVRAGIDIIAPAAMSYTYGASGSYQSPPYHTQGTSFAAPAVAGATAQLRDAMYQVTGQLPDSRSLFVNMLLMTDGYDYAGGAAARRTAGASDVSGLGRLVMRSPQSQDFPSGPWSWAWSSFSVVQNQVVTKRFYDRFGWLRYALTWFGDDTNALADVDLYAYYNCSGSRTFLASQTDYDVRNRLMIDGSVIPATCAGGGAPVFEIDIVGYNIPSGQSRTLWDAVLTHSEPQSKWARFDTGCATQIAGGGGQLWVIGCSGGADRGIYNLQGNSWVQYPGAAANIGVSSEGVPWVVCSGGEIFKWTGSTWEQKAGYASSIAVGSGDDAYIIRAGAAQNRAIAHWNGSQFIDMPGSGSAVQVAYSTIDARPWVRNSYGYIFYNTGTGWAQIVGGGNPLGNGGSSLTVKDYQGQSIWAWKNSTGQWLKVLPGQWLGSSLVGFGQTFNNSPFSFDGFWAIDGSGGIYSAEVAAP
jgi:hypothetical protein